MYATRLVWDGNLPPGTTPRSCSSPRSERRDHLAGAVGAALLTRLFELGRARRDLLGRAVRLSRRGEDFLSRLA